MKKGFVQKKRHPLGSPPGTLMHLGRQRSGPVTIRITSWDKEQAEHLQDARIADAAQHLEDPRTSWITITGVHDPSLVKEVGEAAGIHPLFLEDIMNTMIRPKIEILEDQVLIIMKSAAYEPELREVVMEQVSIILGPTYVITFLEQPADIFDPVFVRINSSSSQIRSRGADFLAYALADVLVDRFYTVLDAMEDDAEALETAITEDPQQQHSRLIHRMRSQLIMLRKTVWPIREILRSIQHIDESLVRRESQIFYADVYDHVIQIMDHIDTLRDVISGLSDMYMGSISNRMNAVMKVLTIIATIFIPLTFIAGVYGMNFEVMPELSWRWGYAAVLAVMAVTAGGMVIFFKRKRWL